MLIETQVSLKDYNTLAVDAKAEYLVTVTKAEQLPEILLDKCWQKRPLTVLGGGSNVVLSRDIEGLVLCMNNTYIHTEEKAGEVFVTAAAGENWHNLVLKTLQAGFYGLENLVLIPGLVGAAPIQNIGAYGAELQDVFYALKGWHIRQKQWLTLDSRACEFSYRDSVFKNALKDQFIITEVTLKLSKEPNVNIHYKGLADYLQRHQIAHPTPEQIADAVSAIRQSKLPDPCTLPNVGSFFKNPVISKEHYNKMLALYPHLPAYTAENSVKIPAAWLLEKAGWKGREVNGLMMHEQQALVLVNPNNKNGADIVAFASEIQQDIAKQFDIDLAIEPRVY